MCGKPASEKIAFKRKQCLSIDPFHEGIEEGHGERRIGFVAAQFNCEPFWARLTVRTYRNPNQPGQTH